MSLNRTLGPLMLWGLGVGYVISGEYFGWNLGLAAGGPLGLLIASLLVSVMMICFVFSYAELACALPRAGGAFVYGSRALGPGLGYLAGLAQLIEFVFAPPAIAAAIGGYFTTYFPSTSPLVFAISAYFVFTALNIWGVKQSAIFELVITCLAIGELLVFAAVTGPHFSMQAFTTDPLPHGWTGILGAIPFAIWFYLAIEGVANVAEEAKNPKRDIVRGFGSAILTLVALALMTLVCSVGVAGWKAVVYAPGSSVPLDTPLPLAFARVVGSGHALYHVLVTIGLFGLIASFNGIVLVAGRVIMEFGRVGYAPIWVGRTHPVRQTPVAALLINFGIGILALLTGKTGEIITLAVFGALTLYLTSMISVIQLRRSEPNLERPFRAPFHPLGPIIALVLAALCLGAMVWSYPLIAGIYIALIAAAYFWYIFYIPKSRKVRRLSS